MDLFVTLFSTASNVSETELAPSESTPIGASGSSGVTTGGGTLGNGAGNCIVA